MSLPYIRIEYGESVNSKKQLLACQIHVLNLVNQLTEYKKQRKTELAKKARLRVLVRQSITKLNTLMNELPQLEGQRLVKGTRLTGPKIQDNKKRTIDLELEDIKRKLSSIR